MKLKNNDNFRAGLMIFLGTNCPPAAILTQWYPFKRNYTEIYSIDISILPLFSKEIGVCIRAGVFLRINAVFMTQILWVSIFLVL